MGVCVGTFVSPISIEDDWIWKTYFCCKKSCKCCSKRSTTHVIMTLIEFPIQPWKKKNFFTSSTIVLLVDKFEALIATNRRDWCLQVNHQVNSRRKKEQSRKKEFVSKIYPFLFFSSVFFFSYFYVTQPRENFIMAVLYDTMSAQVWVANLQIRVKGKRIPAHIVCARGCVWARAWVHMHECSCKKKFVRECAFMGVHPQLQSIIDSRLFNWYKILSAFYVV